MLSPRRAAHVSFREPGGPVRAVVLVLHGGKVRSRRRPRRRQLAVARMTLFAAALARAGRPGGLVVGSVLYRYRGWNGDEASPAADVRHALDESRRRYGNVPVVLVGHSMGGRAALLCADAPSVVAVAALAPWIDPVDPVVQLSGTRLLILHGDRDRWTDPRASRAYLMKVQPVVAQGIRIELRGEGHTMLGRASVWHQLTVAFVLAALGIRDPADRAASKSTDPAGSGRTLSPQIPSNGSVATNAAVDAIRHSTSDQIVLSV